ncbi:hypothetical protein UA08_01174 [Talaromyces atroroseus]|uniref:FAS1 domain-containing protein n=1 Tax=Talaromyces atroroseus TaxID=1441469 RepID=A0A1Q5Q9R6_TALAT|nr:hypothetical protein UA08_01174 [Talaromyces atroroseus]OKL62672.1 hypothetical protein UA08_01174 [Talaromyces atroroseus]
MPKFKGAIYQLSVAAFAVAIFGLCTQLYVRMLMGGVEKKTNAAIYENQKQVPNHLPGDLSLPSLYDVVRNDSRLSRFQRVLSYLPPDIVSFIEKADVAPTTLFAPIDDAFAQESFRWDTSALLWVLLSLYHHVPGNFTLDDLKAHDTIPTHHFADIFESFAQPISIQYSRLNTRLNHRATIVESEVKARNGHLYYIDRVLMLPNSTAYITRNSPEFSLLRKGLDETGLAVVVNDTSIHHGQTFFAPSNAAFKKLGSRVNDFLFSPWGKTCLRALLEYHVIANQTLFTNSHFKANGRGPGLIYMSTMVKPLQVKVNIVKNGERGALILNDAIPVTQSDIVVQDGVIHRVDEFLLPPKPETEAQNSSHSTPVWKKIWFKLFRANQMTVEELMERFEPYIDQLQDGI